jgi:D-sedoheptulose 7-phosphate isomerase
VETIFSEQVKYLAAEGDLLISFSSEVDPGPIMSAVMEARRMHCRTIAVTGSGGKKLASLCDAALLIPAADRQRLQTAYCLVGNLWRESLLKDLKKLSK